MILTTTITIKSQFSKSCFLDIFVSFFSQGPWSHQLNRSTCFNIFSIWQLSCSNVHTKTPNLPDITQLVKAKNRIKAEHEEYMIEKWLNNKTFLIFSLLLLSPQAKNRIKTFLIWGVHYNKSVASPATLILLNHYMIGKHQNTAKTLLITNLNVHIWWP